MRIVLAGLLAGLTVLTGTASSAAAAAPAEKSPPPRLSVPPPTGRLAVGSDTLHLVDDDRTDPWVPSSGARELMVTLWYPTALDLGNRTRYVTKAESEAFFAFQRAQGVPIPDDLPADVMATTRTHSRDGARPLPRIGGRPLVLLSPGFTLPRATLTGLAEDLASRGYVVAAIDHAYESSGTSFPSGLRTCVACEVAEAKDVPPVRRADASFVLDRLTGRNPAWRWSRIIDERHIAMVGHSIGGASASAAMAVDRRIDAGVNLDGTVFTPLPEDGLDRPFMLFGTQRLHHPGGEDETWDATWAKLHGPRYWFSVDDTGHLSFTDTAVLANQIGIEDPTAPMKGVRATEITRAYVGAFLDRHLRGRDGSLLDGESPRFTEVNPHH